MGQQYLGLSLFIILLCFFIVINSLSTFEQIKTQDVLQSLQFAFAGKLEGDDVLPSVQASTTETFEKGDTLDKNQRIVQRANQDVQSQQEPSGDRDDGTSAPG